MCGAVAGVLWTRFVMQDVEKSPEFDRSRSCDMLGHRPRTRVIVLLRHCISGRSMQCAGR